MDIKDLDKRIKHLEDVLPNLSRLDIVFSLEKKLGAVEKKICDDIDKLWNDKIDETQKVQRLESRDTEIISKFKDLSANLDQLMTQFLCIEKDIRSIESKLVHLVNDHKIGLEIVNEKIDATTGEGSYQEELKNLENTVSSFNEIATNSIEMLNSKFDLWSREIQENVDSINTHICSLYESKAEIEKIKKDINVIQKTQAGIYLDVIDKTSKDVSDFKKELRSSIEAIPIPKEVDIEEIKSIVKLDIEHMQLDSKIAVLKSNSNESKIALIEKKIEQIYLMMNQ